MGLFSNFQVLSSAEQPQRKQQTNVRKNNN